MSFFLSMIIILTMLCFYDFFFSFQPLVKYFLWGLISKLSKGIFFYDDIFYSPFSLLHFHSQLSSLPNSYYLSQYNIIFFFFF